ncbi:MAG: 23S rRNA (uracil(1939)-C(5))-methyltransferase RlmD [Endomicrobium sp.]|jgi:23S rRNA (uracil-5-)-methyltransferase RumA|nr:23S rRNA (uracil(1939)-C(5))-methyltransferase RlmD [Endomicrobium sp.]
MYLKNKIINVVSEKIVFPGRSLCRCSDGIVLFTDGLLPGESADVLVIKDKKTFREGLLKNISSKSCERIDSLCSSFGVCGGCSFQNIPYKNQIKYKQGYVSELLNFAGIEISTILTSSQIWHYRNKMEFSFFNKNKDNTIDLGLHRRGSFNKYVSVPSCFIADKDFSQVVEAMKRLANKNNFTVYNNKTHKGFFKQLVLRKAQNNNQFLINIVTNAIDTEFTFLDSFVKEMSKFAQSIYWTLKDRIISEAVLSDKLILVYGKSFITEKLNIHSKDYFFNISPLSFFQTNSKGTEILYNEVVRLLNPSMDDILLDLYCGVGTIGISLACSVKKVIGIEQLRQAIVDAKENALINNIYNTEFYVSSVENWVKENNISFDVIVVDPARSGLAVDVIGFLIESKAKRIVYVSCNPSTLVRDLQIIIESAKYKIKEIVPIDMFPQTYHVEVVVLLEAL